MCCPVYQKNMQEYLSHEMCPHKQEFPFIRVPITRGDCNDKVNYSATTMQIFSTKLIE